MDERYSIRKADFASFLKHLSHQYEVFAPVRKGDQRFYKKITDSAEGILIGEVRAFEPLKAFFSRAREKVADDFQPDVPHRDDKPFAIVGVKACDLKGFKIQDFVFKGNGFKDSFYIRHRDENLIISADCTCAIETCYCLALGVEPHPKGDFDLNLSPVRDGFIVEAGSEKGKALLKERSSLFNSVAEEPLKEREEQRARVRKAVEENIKKHGVPHQDRFQGIVERNWTSDLWNEEAKTCVECGACTIICPTCHCFLLYDQKDENKMARLRVWDSCMLKDYARVAGGANPRAKLWMRLRNRFDKKFDFFPKVAQVYACTGCGRCITACPAKIDIRRVLKRLVGDAK
ncbi:MAG: 4Fe-4S dicluster domain-containing protein [Elusimicrobia bacterium]|nr:4Fe-4S dicluster domain-containing protein [Candidatus Obscuribacterium magneticum]